MDRKASPPSSPAAPWTPQQKALLCSLYPMQTAAQVAQAIGRSVTSIESMVNRLGLHKAPEFWRGRYSTRFTSQIAAHPYVLASQFKPGHLTWNKGMKGFRPAGSDKSRFKKGNTPHTFAPVGSYRITSDGDLQIKWRDCPGANNLRWKPVARLVWEAYHGLIAPGMLIVFKPGTRSAQVEQIRIENLECISRAEHVQRNHPRNKSPELGRLAQLKGAITRQVNRIAQMQKA